MTGAQQPSPLDDRLAARESAGDAATVRDDVATTGASVVDGRPGDATSDDMRLFREVESLSRFIRQVKTEVAQIRPAAITGEHIPVATEELDAIVAATEVATGAILDCVESIEAEVPAMPQDCGDKVQAAVTGVYEACNFQDITGQRISKVVRALKEIESKVDALVSTFGEDLIASDSGEDASSADRDAAGDDERHLLNGPQSAGEGISQADIDALLGTTD